MGTVVQYTVHSMYILYITMLCIYIPTVYTQCNCFDCKNITEGPYQGTYYYMGNQGQCLYRNPHSGAIIRACDNEASLGDSYVYELCTNVTGPKVCIDPPEPEPYGYLNRTWDGTKNLQVSKVSYYCPPPKVVTNYNGSAVYDIWCSAARFPQWQFTVGYNQLPFC